ncbi:MAG: LysR family transcriptional regulator [Gammaproteobacteria bacterium]|nr:LysR family transcriptional regulator [Gammaproteobacteria bacterium]MBV9697115.1 LysR family transcriptional regulator [Gammaproteobacteria bacterium]
MQKKSIDRRWLPLNALRAFEGVAKHGSFTAAANALLISQSALSRHVIALERLTGVQLFERRPHALTLTKAGQHLLPAVVKSFDRLEYALDDIRNEGAPMQRTLRVQMPPSFALQLAVPILRDFRRASTEVDIDLVSPYGVGPPVGDVDVAVVYSRPSVTDLVSDLLWPVRLTLLCHPGIAAAHRGKDLGAFIEANEIVHVRIAEQPRHHAWSEFVREQGLAALNVERGLVFDTALLAAQYVMGGQGVALIDPNLFEAELRCGQLVRPFTATFDDGFGYYLTTHPEGLGDTAVALFRSWLIERFGRRDAAPVPAVQLAVSNE